MGGLLPTTPISDPRVRAVFLTDALKGGASPSSASRQADCVINGLRGLGIATAADIPKVDSSKLFAVEKRCIQANR